MINDLIGYIEENDCLSRDFLKKNLREVSIKNCVSNELINLLLDNPFEPPSDVIEDFAIKMLGIASDRKGHESSYTFYDAAFFALDILDAYHERKEKKHEFGKSNGNVKKND